MKSQSIPPGFHSVRRDQLRQEREHDTYKLQKKPSEPSVCKHCGVVFRAGRWQWGERQSDSVETTCTACLRIRDNFPAGFVHVSGPFLEIHRDEILNLLQHHADREKMEHPMARIITTKYQEGGEDGILIATTDIHLARNLGEALHHAYRGTLEYHYNDAQNQLRVHWQR